MKILVLGNGFIGKPLAEFLEADTTTKRLDEIYGPDLAQYEVVINAAAKTSIDWCEKNREETFDTNVTQAVRIAKLLEGIRLMTESSKGKHVFFSSACIFKSDFIGDDNTVNVNFEDSIPNPQCFYTYTKLMAEQLIEEISPNTLIIRPRLLISEKSHPRNTIDKLLKYDKIIDTQESATILEDLLPKVKELIDLNETGAFHIFNEGTTTPSEIATLFDHPHEQISKFELDLMTSYKGNARRVSTVLGSKRTKPLSDINKRLKEIRASWVISKE